MEEQFTVKGITGELRMNRSAYEEYQKASESRLAMGRYSLEEAAIFIHEATGERADEMRSKLMASAGTGALATYEPGKKARYKYGDNFASRVRDFYEEAYFNDLNKWLSENESRLNCQFPAPDVPAAKGEAGADTNPSDDWPKKARAIADECFDHDTNAKPTVRDSLATKNSVGHITGGYCFRVMVLMQERGIKGPRGIITSPATIMREALQGKKWWANKSK